MTSKADRLKILIGKGYFPEELPPPFNTNDLAKLSAFLSKNWPSTKKPPNTRFQRHSIPRLGEARRNLAITNPVGQFYLARHVAENWVAIRKHLKKSKHSVPTLEITSNENRSIPTTDFDDLRNRRLSISASNNYQLISDISRFYPTLYTHVIPWALHGKEWSKQNLFQPAYKNSPGAKLDDFVRATQENQTLGIPIGPDTSRIISEIVAIGIEQKFQEYSSNNLQFVRHIDDIVVGAKNISEAENYRSNFERALDYFEAQINSEKTKTVSSGHPTDSLWVLQLSDFHFSYLPKRQNRELIHYFHLAFDLSEQNRKENVLRYAISRTKGINVTKSNWPLYEAFLLKVGRVNATCVRDIVQIFADYNWQNYPLNKNVISKYITDIISEKAAIGHHNEVSWVLFLAKALRITIDTKCFEYLKDINCSACRLLILDLESRGLIAKKFNKSLWNGLVTTDNLNSELWLFVYEAHIKGWLTAADRNFVQNHDFFKFLEQKKISFYDTNKNVVKISELRKRTLLKNLKAEEMQSKIFRWSAT